MSRAYIAPALAVLGVIVAFTVASWRSDIAATSSYRVPVVSGSHRASPAQGSIDPVPSVKPENPAPAPRAEPTSLAPEMIARMGGLAKSFPDVAKRFATLRSEPRDPVWAPASERMLTLQYAAIPGIGGEGRLLDIHCATDNCVVIGDLPRGADGRKAGEVMSALQSIDLVEKMMARGFNNNGSGFGPSASDNRRMFVTFYKRGVPKQVTLR